MAEKIVSPGVFTKEIDASFLPAAVGDIGAAVIGPTVKGPAMVPTVVTSYAEFQEKFGDVFISGSNEYTYLTSATAKEYLRNAGRLTVVRILDGDYGGATATVADSITSSATGAVAATGSVKIVGNPFNSTTNDVFQITVGGTAFNFIAASGSNNADTVLPPDGTNNFYYASGSSTANSLDNLVAKIDAASIGVDAVDGTTHLHITASSTGTSGNSITVQTGSNDTQLAATQLTLGGGKAGTGGAGTSFKLNTIADGAIMNNSEASSGTNNILTSGSKDNLRFEIASKNNSKGTFTLLIRRGDDTHKNKQILETWNNVSLDPREQNYIGKVIGDSVVNIVGSGGSDPFLQMSGSFPNKSKYVYVSDIKDTIKYLDENGVISNGALSGSLPTVGSGSLNGGFSGGKNGEAGFDALGNVVGTYTSAPYNFYDKISSTNSQGFRLNNTTSDQGGSSYIDALNLLANADEYDINLLLIPGIVDNFGGGHTGIITKAIDVCEARGDCFLIYDSVGYDTTNISTVTTKVEERDSNYAATYWPWVQTTDSQTGQMTWVPPSTVLSGIYSFNDKIAAPWFAPAGLNRGGLDTVIQAARKLTHANRDDLYESNVNPIATFPGQGVCVWGQKTLQKKSSALDRVNVRRLMIKVKKFIAASSRFLVFEQNTAQTRERFLNIANPYLEQVQSQSGLSAFRVVMDESNNTPDIVDRNILFGQIFLQPTRTAEFIVLDFTIQPTGASFPE